MTKTFLGHHECWLLSYASKGSQQLSDSHALRDAGLRPVKMKYYATEAAAKIASREIKKRTGVVCIINQAYV